jgi:hypothetical protein
MIYTSLIQGTYIYIHDFINYVSYLDIYVYIYIYIYIYLAKSTMSNQPSDPAPNFAKMAHGISIGDRVGNLGWKICSHCQGHEKSTISNDALGPAPNFSKIIFCMSVRVQVGGQSGKCAPLGKTMQNQQCPVSLLTMPQASVSLCVLAKAS